MQEKVLVVDIDGTLTNSKKEITEATKQGIWNILQHGHKVILASGQHGGCGERTGNSLQGRV